MKKLLALLAALTVLLALAGCGANENAEDTQEDSTQVEDTIPEESTEEPEEPEEPEALPSEETDAPAEEETAGEDDAQAAAPEEKGMTLSSTDFTLFKAGSSYRLKATGAKENCVYTSSNPKVATVGADGTVTAVAPGNAVITVTSGSQTATCVVRCNWTTQKPEEKPEDKPAEKPAAESVDLSQFYQDTIGKYAFQNLQEFTGEVLDTYYPGMNDVDTKQCLVMGTMLSMNNGEFCLAEVTNASDVDTVKKIFQDRVDYMAESGAWYPGPTELWTNSSRVVSNGNYVMMVVHESCDQIVDDFNALFS